MTRVFRFLFMGLVFVYLYLPISILVMNSFNKSRYGLKWQGFSWRWYEKMLDNDGLMQAAINSLTIATLSATAACIIGTLGAVALFRYKFHGKQLLSGSLFVLMMAPDIVMAIAFLSLFILLGIKLGFFTLLIAHITFCLPFVVVSVYSRLNGFDVRIIEAARDLGAPESVIFFKILMPLALPAIFAGWMLSFTLSLDDVIVSSFVTGPGYEILPIKIYSMVKIGVSPEVNALAATLLVVSVVLVSLSQLISKIGQAPAQQGDVR